MKLKQRARKYFQAQMKKKASWVIWLKGGKIIPDLLYSLVTSDETVFIWVVLHNKFLRVVV